MTLFHQASDALHRILATDISRGPSIADVPERKRRRKDSAAARQFKIVRRRQIDQFAWNLIEKTEQRVNLGTVDIGDGAGINFVSAGAEHAINGVYDLARKNFWH